MFVAGAQSVFHIWLRSLASAEARPIEGTEGGSFPFWSPDSQSIAFFAGAKLKKVAIAGGPPIVLADAAGGAGGSWSRDNVIVFGSGRSGLFRVSRPAPASQQPSRRSPTERTLIGGRTFYLTGGISSTPP